MCKLINNIKRSRTILSHEYAQVNANPVAKAFIQIAVMMVDIFILFVLVWNMFHFFIPPGSWINIVDGNSMYPTMHSGQILFTDVSGKIERGDVITAKTPQYAINQNPDYEGMVIVKRVVGVPGDRIVIDQTGVYVNGELLVEDYLTDSAKYETYIENKCNSVRLDNGEYFIMGDNRGVSYDSRSFGVVNEDEILYKQSETPTNNFYLKLVLIVLMFVLDAFLYSLVEFILTECAYGLFFNRKKNDHVINSDDAVANTIETVILKGDNN
jgi:signal peptidase I